MYPPVFLTSFVQKQFPHFLPSKANDNDVNYSYLKWNCITVHMMKELQENKGQAPKPETHL